MESLGSPGILQRPGWLEDLSIILLISGFRVCLGHISSIYEIAETSVTVRMTQFNVSLHS